MRNKKLLALLMLVIFATGTIAAVRLLAPTPACNRPNDDLQPKPIDLLVIRLNATSKAKDIPADSVPSISFSSYTQSSASGTLDYSDKHYNFEAQKTTPASSGSTKQVWSVTKVQVCKA